MVVYDVVGEDDHKGGKGCTEKGQTGVEGHKMNGVCLS